MKLCNKGVVIVVLCFGYLIVMTDGVLLSRNKPVRMVDQLLDWEAARAIDGDGRTNAEQCQCCSATNFNTDPWFELNLQQEYIITTIDIQGRPTDFINQDYKDLDIFLTRRDDVNTSAPVYSHPTVDYRARYDFQSPVKAQYITLILRGPIEMLVICELQVFGECQDGQYGANCENTCNCLNRPCDKTTGICPVGSCKAGYTGARCDQACTDRRYGLNCEKICGSCANNAGCYVTDGTCPNCVIGYQPPLCQRLCTAGGFGLNCNSTCGRCRDGRTCNPYNGTCTNGCEPGYLGEMCRTACQNGRYGDNCTEECGGCKDGAPCDVTTGRCENGCKTGRRGPLCNLACSPGTYGENCSRVCGKCRNGDPCDPYNGACQGCGPGYLGTFCNRTCLAGKYGYSCLQECGKCMDGTTCSVETGICSYGCAPGYRGVYCKEECQAGYYGLDCQSMCGNCKETTTCDVTSGRCQMGCTTRFTGDLCMQAFQVQDEQGALSSSAVIGIGVSIGAVVVVTLVIVIAVVVLKRRKGEQFQQTQTYSPDTNGVTITTTELPDVPDVLDIQQPRPVVGDKNDLGLVDLDGATDERYKHDYDGFKTRQRGVMIHELWHYIYDQKKKGCVQFYKEFGFLKSGMAHLHEYAERPENKQKNRYKGLYAYDHSRVKLGVEDGHSDYINASFINGFGAISKFIASQGPTEFTVDDFWLMIWQQNTLQIIMLTTLTERGAVKCCQYWPDKGSICYGKLHVKIVSTDTFPEFTIRHLQLSMPDQTVRSITQYQFECWPDKEVPDSTWSLVDFWRRMLMDYNTIEGEAGPIVVHCSAGVGRTGTFIALDNLYHQAEKEGCVTPLNIVDSLRDQRVCMVQTKEQYVFLHEVVADALLLGTHDIKPRHLPAIYNFLLEDYEKEHSLSRLEVQHKLILSCKTFDKTEDPESRPNIQEEPEYSNVPFCTPTQSDDTKGSFLPVSLPYHSGSTGFILVNRPTKDTSDQLWSLITDRGIKTIITLSGPTPEEGNSRTVLEVHTSDVDIIEERSTEDYVADTFRIPRRENTDGKVSTFDLKLFAFKIWDEDTGLPINTACLIRCANTVRDWQLQLSDNAPLLIICRDNIPSAGLFCVILSELDRCSGPTGKVHIVESVQLARACHTAMVDSVHHYKFIFDVLVEFIHNQLPDEDVWI